MKSIMIESVNTTQPSDTSLEVNCVLKGDLPQTLTYKIMSPHLPELSSDLLPVGAEFAVIACMPKAMTENYKIVSKVPLDPVFLSNVKLYQKRMRCKSSQPPPVGWEIYHVFINRFKDKLYEVEVEAEESSMVGASDKRRVGAMCSGGIDSLYTLMGVHEIDDMIFIRNMNQPNVEASLKTLQVLRPDIRIHTVEVPDFYFNPEDTTTWVIMHHGAFLASAALLFSRYFTSMIVSGTDRGPGFEIGSGHDVDYLWSSSHMRFCSYGNVSRFHKVEYLGRHEKADAVFRHLQVCSDSKQRGEQANCSRCWKCLFTMLCIDACGLREKASAFDFTGFAENFTRNIVNWKYNVDYSFLHNMPPIIAGYRKQGNTVMLGLCEEYMRKDKNRIPFGEIN